MFDRELAVEQLTLIEIAAQRVIGRMKGISEAEDFFATEDGLTRFDSILMMLIAIGEQLKKMDKHVPTTIFQRQPQVDWKAAKGMRDRLSHEYFQADPEIVFEVSTERLPQLLAAVIALRAELLEELKTENA